MFFTAPAHSREITAPTGTTETLSVSPSFGSQYETVVTATPSREALPVLGKHCLLRSLV